MQGKWLGLRSAAAGDRFLQARKRSTPSRLVFFSQNVGTWEQWELGSAGPDPDVADWASLPATLRHRRLPQFELAVELVRVGAMALPPNAALTPRSLLAGAAGEQGTGAAAAGCGGDEDPAFERRELQRMSGVLVHVRRGRAGCWHTCWQACRGWRAVHACSTSGAASIMPLFAQCVLPLTVHAACCASLSTQEWLHFVDQEKAARLAIEARVAQLVEDAAGLRDWAVLQVGRCAGLAGSRERCLGGGWACNASCMQVQPTLRVPSCRLGPA